MAVEVPKAMAPVRVETRENLVMPALDDATYNILGQAYIHPISGEFPDIEKKHVDGLGKCFCLVD